MTRHRLLIGASILVAGIVLPRAGRAQDSGAVVPQQQDQQAQMQHLQQTIDQQKQQIQQMQSQSQAEWVAGYHGRVPGHLQIGNQQYDVSLDGFRAYLETLKSSDPTLYGQLAPDVAVLDAKRVVANEVWVGGVAVGLASIIYGLASRDNCAEPMLSSPNFGAAADASFNCNSDNLKRTAVFTILGVSAMAVGTAIGVVSRPQRADIMELVNKHNRLSQQPLQLQIGYDPTQHLAFSGATVAF